MYKLFDIAALISVEPHQARLILLLLESAVNKAIIQHERIEYVKKREIRPGPSMNKTMTTLFSDIHHYFICWEEVNKLIKYLIEVQPIFEFTEAQYLELKKHCDFRNHLEHITERIKRGVSDLGNLSNNEFSFDGESVDISLTDLEKLKELYKNTLDIARDNFKQHYSHAWPSSA